MTNFDVLGIVGYTCFCLLCILGFILAFRKLKYSNPYKFKLYEIDKDKKYIVNIDVGDLSICEVHAIMTKLKEVFDHANMDKNIVGYIPTRGDTGTTAFIPFQDFKIPLWQFIERFVGHNTTVYIYKENLVKDEEGNIRLDSYTLLEKVMDWQCFESPYEDEHFKNHSDVKRSKYINNNVIKTLNCFEETLHERIDAVAIVIDIDSEKDKK